MHTGVAPSLLHHCQRLMDFHRGAWIQCTSNPANKILSTVKKAYYSVKHIDKSDLKKFMTYSLVEYHKGRSNRKQVQFCKQIHCAETHNIERNPLFQMSTQPGPLLLFILDHQRLIYRKEKERIVKSNFHILMK